MEVRLTTRLAIFLSEYFLAGSRDDPRPCIVLLGRDETGKKRKYRVPYDPYLYVEEWTFKELKEEIDLKRYVKEIEPVWERSLGRRALMRFKAYDCNDLKYLDEFIHKRHRKTYEADMSKVTRFPLRYLIDLGIKSGVEILNNEKVPIDLICPLRRWYIDFEWASEFMSSANPRRDEPIIMVTVFDSYLSKLYTIHTKPGSHFERYRLPEIKHYIMARGTEEDLLKSLLGLLTELDPDIILGWNLMRADIEKWFSRMERYRMPLGKLSPFNSVDRRQWPYTIKGRVLFDLMTAFKLFTLKELRSYALEFIAKKEKLGKKVAFKGPTAEIWRSNPEVIFRRNVTDVLIIKALDEKYGVLDAFDTLRREFGCQFHDVLVRHRIIDTGLLRMVNGQTALGTVKVRGAKGSFLGGLVIEPEPGHYTHVVQFDLSRQYPRIIQKFNISPETFVEDGTGFYKIERPDGGVYSFARSPVGLFPRFISYLFKLRDAIEEQMSEYVNDPVKYKAWDRRMWAVKSTSNACFGVMGFEDFRLYRPECSAAIPLIGRESVQVVIRAAEDLGYKVLYGDTDSVFIKLKSEALEDQIGEAKALAESFNSVLAEHALAKYKIVDSPFQISAKRIYSDWISLSKKQYAGRYVWDEKKALKVDYEFKNIVVRSDTSDLERTVQETILKMRLNRIPYKKIKVYAEAVLKQLMRSHYEPIQVAYPAGIQKASLTSYKTTPAHVKAVVYSNAFLRTDFQPGDKPRRLPIRRVKREEKTYDLAS